MKFAPLTLRDAEGAILAHSLRVNGDVLKKGRVLTKKDITTLAQGGLHEVIAARLEEGDVHEDEAAHALAEVAAGDGVRAAEAATGRSNLFAEQAGLVVVNREQIDAVNRVDESLTIATLPPFTRVTAGQMIATIKVIPFSAPATALATATGFATKSAALLRVAPFTRANAGLILTQHAEDGEKLAEKARHVLTARLERLGSSISAEIICDHTELAVSEAVAALRAKNCSPILILGASATVDRRDVVPAGITRAGAVIEHLGMPVDPGNLLLLAHDGATPVIGVPGCARSPKLNGFDWILERLLAGIPVESEDITSLGVGGLLKDVVGRPQPRETVVEAASAAKIGAIVLAAGQSRRMRQINKLLQEVDGKPMVARVVDTVLAAGISHLVVVTGHQAPLVEAALSGRNIRFAHNPEYAEGLSTSLRYGLAALSGDVEGALICLGDMPWIKTAHLHKLMGAFNPAEGRAICLPTTRGKRGNPNLWSRQFFGDMARITGDVGARHLIGEYADLVTEVPIEDDAIFVDVDDPAALAAARKKAEAENGT